MRVALLAFGLLSLAAAQNIDFVAIKDAPTPSVQGPPVTGVSQTPTYKPSVASASAAKAAATDPVAVDDPTPGTKRAVEARPEGARFLEARSPCQQQPDGYGPVSSPDTDSAFLADPQYPNIANSAPVPQGYALVFSDYQGSTSQNGYMGFYTFSKYDTIQCQQKCDAAAGCTAFNMFIERDPSLEPADACPNPASMTNFRCSLWGLPVTNDTATNNGQWRDQFHVVIAGSNGYVKNAAPPSYAGFTGPVALGGGMQAPSSYMGMKFYPGVYDPGQCAAACQATTTYDHEHANADGTYDACNFFNAYVLSENNSPQGTYCNFYTQAWDRSYATNVGQYDGEGNYYSVSSSYAYTLTQQDAGHV